MIQEINSRKLLIIGMAIFMGIFVSSSIYFLIPRSYIKFITAPEQVSIMIDGKDKQAVQNGDTVLVSPGKHTVVVFRDEFNPHTETVNVENGQTFELVAALTGLTDNATNLLQSSDVSSSVMGRFNDSIMLKVTDFTSNTYQIIKVLPIQARLYTVSSCQSEKFPNNTLRFALCVDSSQDGLEPYVRKDITWRGFNPDDYEIIYSVDASLTQ